jgi:ATP-dependent helicase/nuclease subunit B
MSLKHFCRQYPFQRKILIAPSYRAGNELRESLARHGGGFVNLCAETVDGLARKAAGVFIAQNELSLLSASQASEAFENVYRQCAESGALAYFSSRNTSDGLVSTIAAAILELRSFGITGNSIDTGNFISPEKGRDIRELLCAYGQYLLERNYIDPPGLLAIAREQPIDPEDAFFLIPPFLCLNPLEQEFIKSRIPAERLFVLQSENIPDTLPPHATPVGIWPDRLVDCREDDGLDWATGAGPFDEMIQPGISPGRVEDYYTWHKGDIRIIGSKEASHLLAKDPHRDDVDEEDAMPDDDDGDLTLFHAYGATNEAREVLRRLIAMPAPLDTVAVAYTGSEYIQVFYSLCQRAGFEMTASDGIPTCLTRPGKALKGIVDWIKSDFSANVLRRMLIEGSICLRPGRGELELPPLDAAEILRDSGIGWGRERYSRLTAYTERMTGELAGLEDGDGKCSCQEKVELAAQLDSAMQDILSLIPDPDAAGSVDFGKFVAAIAAALRKLARTGNELDVLALNGLLLLLGEIARMASFSLSLEDALDRMADAVNKLSVGASSPKPGALHLAPYRSLIWTGRPNTFVVGLDANSFPGGVSQDPVLLDSERKLIHPELPLGCDRPRLRQYEMLTALYSRDGRVSLSYPSFDVVENRVNLPSSLLLRTFRLLKNDTSMDYSDLQRFLGNPAGYCPHDHGQALDETEWWLERLLAGCLADDPALVRQCYRNVDRGQAVLSARQGATPTEYDGMVSAAGDAIVRRGNHSTMSCSRIEYLAGCPFAYFLRYVLRLNPPEKVAYDPGRWLEPMERGLLLHELYCNFMKEIVRRKQRVSSTAHRNMMYEMADKLIDRHRMVTPPPGEVVFNREVRDIRDSCDVFLTVEESDIESAPVFFEVPFGLPGKMSGKDMGSADPVRIDLGSGVSFSLRGQIDRIDRVSKDVYCIWDYKTGSSWGYEGRRYLCRGRQIQHALYAIAAEKMLKNRFGGSPRVESSGYYFPTRKGEGRRAVRPESDRSLITSLMGHLFDILKNGTFLATDDGEACGYCDYAEVCDQKRAVSRAKALISDTDNSGLDPWRRLKNFE